MRIITISTSRAVSFVALSLCANLVNAGFVPQIEEIILARRSAVTIEKFSIKKQGDRNPIYQASAQFFKSETPTHDVVKNGRNICNQTWEIRSKEDLEVAELALSPSMKPVKEFSLGGGTPGSSTNLLTVKYKVQRDLKTIEIENAEMLVKGPGSGSMNTDPDFYPLEDRRAHFDRVLRLAEVRCKK